MHACVLRGSKLHVWYTVAFMRNKTRDYKATFVVEVSYI